MMLCLLAGAVVVPLMTDHMTLSWHHSVEHTRWQEDWVAEPGGLRLRQARIEGSGAGMDPPPNARFENGMWAYTPRLPLLPEVVLRRSGATADYRVCRAGTCTPMGDLLPGNPDPVTLTTCTGAPPKPPAGVLPPR